MNKDTDRKPDIRAASVKAPAAVKVRLPASRGALRCGQYVAGQVYELPHDEAERMVRVKGFEVVGDAPDDSHQINREE